MYTVIGDSFPKNTYETLLDLKLPLCTSNQFKLISFIFTAAKQTLAKAWKSWVLIVAQVIQKIL